MAAKANTPTTEEETHLLTVKGIYYACGAQKELALAVVRETETELLQSVSVYSRTAKDLVYTRCCSSGDPATLSMVDTKLGHYAIAWTAPDGHKHMFQVSPHGAMFDSAAAYVLPDRQKLLCSKDKRTLTIDTSVTDYVPRMFGTIVQVANLTGRLAVHNGKFVRITQLPDMTAAVDTTHIPKLGVTTLEGIGLDISMANLKLK